MIAEKYELENGQALFISRKTRTRLQDDIFANNCAAPTLASLEYSMNFKMFVSICNLNSVFSWLTDWFDHGLLHRVASWKVKIWLHHIGILGFATWTAFWVGSLVGLSLGSSHQNECSGHYASGTMKFVDKPNEELGAILRKIFSWKKSRALRRVWHKPECIVEANIFFGVMKFRYESVEPLIVH
jgi:hypothetical protein